MKSRTFLLSALVALTGLVGHHARAESMATLAIAPSTGVVTLVPRWTIGGSLSGFHHMAQDLSVGGGPNQFYSIKGTAIPAGGDISAFTRYIAGTGAATPHADIGSKLTPNSYSALTSSDPDLGYGAVNFYLIHHKGTTDYFSVIKPSSGVASSVADLKPMSGPGGPATVTGVGGYFGFTFAAANLGYGLNLFYYLRTDPVTGNTKFGTLEPALLGTSADKFDLGTSGHNALVFTGTDVGYGTDKMYFVRLDPITGYSILGTLHPLTGRASDIANLGSVYSTLAFVPGDVGFGAAVFYTTGAVNPQWQSVSFAALQDRAISAGSFSVSPSASSALPIALTVVTGSTGAASISGPVSGVFTVTPTAPGLITLQATQAGSPGSVAYNMLRQSFTATGVATLVITTQPTAQSAVTASTANFSVIASGTTTLSYQWRKAGITIAGNASATTATLSLANVQAADAVSYDVVVTNASGSLVSNTVTLTVTGSAPVITNSPLTAAGTVGAAFTFTVAASGSPTGYTAAPLPAGLTLNATTGAITGTPTTAGTTTVGLGATNGTGTGNATLTVTVAAAGVAPIITTVPGGPGSAGTVGTPFSYAIVATGTPTSYTAAPLPAGLSLNATTGVISGTPTTAGTTTVALGATNATGTSTGALTIAVAAAGVAPIITTAPGGTGSAGTVGAPFSYAIVATGTPTSYTAAPLPAGLSLNATTGVISGTPTTAGTTTVALGATNSIGTSTGALTITVAAAGVAPVIATAPGGTGPAGTVGAPYVYAIVATGTPTGYTASPLPAGLTLNATTGVISGTPTTAGTTTVTLGATNSTGTTTGTLTISVAAAVVPPVITPPPGGAGPAGSVGAPFNYPVTATGTPTSYTANPLPPGLSINSTTGVISGTPTTPGTTVVTITATNPAGTTSTTVTIVVAALPSSRIVNFAARALSGPGSQTLIMGFVVSGNGKNMLVRGIGPTLAALGVTTALADPLLTLFDSTGALAQNDNWEIAANGQNQAALIAAMAARVGAFALPAGSKDAALLFTVNDGAHTTGLLRPNSTTGVALTEVYDIDLEPGARLINVSARMNVTAGEGILIAGLVIAGDAPKTVLIRGIGPTLSVFGVAGVLADPQITVFAGLSPIASNDNWETAVGTGSSAQTALVASRVGAFALSAGSKDAALVITLQPGAYTVQVSGVANTTGVALIEVYEAP